MTILTPACSWQPQHQRNVQHQVISTSRVRSKLKVQNSSTFQGPQLHFSSTKIIDKKPYPRRGHSKFRLQCDTWSVLYCTHQYRNDKSKWQIAVINLSAIHIERVRFKFKDFSRIFKYFQLPYLFSSTFKGLEVFIPNSSIFKDFSSTLWTLYITTDTWSGIALSQTSLVYPSTGSQPRHKDEHPTHVLLWSMAHLPTFTYPP